VEVVVEGVPAGIHQWWWVPVAAAGGGVDLGGPPEFGELVVGPAPQRQTRGVSVPAPIPAGLSMVGLAVACGFGAAGSGAAAVTVIEQQALGFGGQAFGAAHVERPVDEPRRTKLRRVAFSCSVARSASVPPS
jgi:hypothetical protein